MKMETLCRACLSLSPDMMLMDEIVINKYNIISNVDIKYREDMPLYSCKTCFDALNFCIDFREKCISSDMRLKEMTIKKHDTITKIEELSDTEIKEEVKMESESDQKMYEDNSNDNSDASSDDDDMKLSQLKEAKTPSETIENEKATTSKPINYTITKNDRGKTFLNVCLVEISGLVDCGLCLKQFENMPLLLKHLEDHTDNTCEICSEILGDIAHVMGHRFTHVSKKQQRCHLCAKSFVSELATENHFVKIHNFRGEGGQLQCKFCSKPYQNLRALRTHIHGVHRNTIFKCDKCDKRYRSKSDLHTHMNTHLESHPFKCELCDYTNKRLYGITLHHRRKHAVGTIECKACKKIFASESLRDSHNCNGAMEVVCTVCGLVVTKLQFPHHMQTHQGKKFACNLCSAQYKTKRSLRSHIDRHQGIKRNQCEYCPKKFYSSTSLCIHRRIHTGERPHKCNQCESAFIDTKTLKAHMKKVHTPDLVESRNAKQGSDLF